MFVVNIILLSNKSKYITYAIVSFFIYLMTYGVCVYSVYAFSDDYNLFSAMNHPNSIQSVTQVMQGGRPLYAGYSFLFKIADNIADLGWIRLIAIAGISAFSTVMLYNLEKNTNLKKVIIYSASLSCGLSPAFQLYASWAIASVFPWAAFLSGLSAVLLSSGSNAWKTILALFLLVASMFIYQPAAMVFWAFLLPVFLYQENHAARFGLMARSLCLMGSSLAVDLLASKILPSLLFANVQNFERTSLATNYLGKIRWFSFEVMPDALSIFSVSPRLWFVLPAFAAIAWSIIIISTKRHSLIKNSSIIVSIMVLSYLPNLIVKESWAGYRSQAGLDTVVILSLFFAISIISSHLKSRYLSAVFSLSLLLTGLFVSHRNVVEYFVNPQVKELALVEKYITSQSNLYEAQNLYFVPASWRDRLSRVMRYDEFGLPSSSKVWVPVGMAWAILKSTPKGVPPAWDHATVGTLDRAPSRDEVLVLDLGTALREAHANYRD